MTSPTLSIPIQWVGPGEPMYPSYQTDLAAGMDLHAAVTTSIAIPAGKRATVSSGICIALPPGYEAQVRPRSGLAFKHGVTVLNSPGTIDADYRGEIKVMLINLGDDTHTIAPGNRIAQLVVAPITRASWQPVAQLDDTQRGDGGFGSTGR